MTFSRDLESPTVTTIGFGIPAANNTLFILVRISIRSNDAIFVLGITTTRRLIYGVTFGFLSRATVVYS